MENNQNKLILLEDLGLIYRTEKSKRKKRYGIYKCHCGSTFEANMYFIKKNIIKNCGCLRRNNISKANKKHGMSYTRNYTLWSNIIQRCENPNHNFYKNYGASGIKICDEWKKYENFMKWSMANGYTDYLTIDRINNDGNYEPNNCRWVDRFVQAQNSKVIRVGNKSGYKGVNWYKNTNRWLARITVNGKRICLGYFKNILDAAKAYDQYVIDNNLEHSRNFK